MLPIPSDPLQPAEIDDIRDVFNANVLSVLTHHVSAQILDAIERDKRPHEQARPTSTVNAPTLAAAHQELIDASLEVERAVHEEIWPRLRDRQRAALARFNGLEETDLPHAVSPIGSIFFNSRTILNTTGMFADRHPELGLHNAEVLVRFLTDPSTPSVLRGIALGGNGFADGIGLGLNHGTAARWNNPEVPVLQHRRERMLVSSELRAAAIAQRRERANVTPESIAAAERGDAGVDPFSERAAATGIFTWAKRTSSGCPNRHLRFTIADPALVEQGLAWTEEQLAMFTSGPRPTARRKSTTRAPFCVTATASCA